MFKNLTINKIALIAAMLVGLINALYFFVLRDYLGVVVTPAYSLIVLLLLVLISFVVIKSLLSRFVFKNIQLIYKMIRSTRQFDNSSVKGLRSEGFNLKDLDDEVFQWAERTKNEITDLKELESYRRNYLGNVSHELKTPIFSILGYLHTLLEGGLHDEKINMRYLKKAAENAMRLENIVKDLEAVNRLESDASLDLTKFDVVALAEILFQELELYSSARDISFKLAEEARVSYMVLADKNKIRQVLTNLLTNSVRYSEEGDEVTVSFHDIQDSILIEVRDNGIGIEEKHLKHLFDRFYRVDPGRSRKFGGSGLGLSIVKHIIEVHNQTINVRSTKGVGSTFAFTLDKAK